MSERVDVEITAGSTTHNWGLMPLRMRASIAWKSLRGRPFTVAGKMLIVAENARRASPGGDREGSER